MKGRQVSNFTRSEQSPGKTPTEEDPAPGGAPADHDAAGDRADAAPGGPAEASVPAKTDGPAEAAEIDGVRPDTASGAEGSAAAEDAGVPGNASPEGAADDGPDTPAGAPAPGNLPESRVAGAAGGSPGAGGAPADGTADDVGDRVAAATTGGRRDRRAAARMVPGAITVLAAILVLAALLLPNRLTSLTLTGFVRLPVESLLLGALLVVLPPRARRVVGALAGLGIALLVIVKVLDMGFYSVLGTPFDLLFDWNLIPDGYGAFSDSAGRTIAILAVVAAAVLVVALLVLLPLAVVRLGGSLARRRRPVVLTILTLGVVWTACTALAVHIPGLGPVAVRNTAALAYKNAAQMRADIRDQQEFQKATTHDPFAATPPDQLLTALRGKNVIFTFVESYGRCAVQDPIIAPGVDALLGRETTKLKAAGFSSRSAFLTSATYGGSSWLGHSTFLSGMWINNQSRYRTVTHSSRMALTAAFQRTGAWRTVGVVPGTRKTWPEAKWEGLDHVYSAFHLGYKGPKFSWSTMPDQYALTAFQRLENGRPHDKPLMTEVVLTSSHEPWAPIPTTIPWDQVGNGSVYAGIKKAGRSPKAVWKHTSDVRAQYGKSIQYSISNLVDFVLKYGDKNTVLVFLGDHQPAAVVSGNNASRDVPVSIVAHDPNVMNRISGWGWQDGLLPDPKTAPVWKMSAFRDRFLTAYGPQPGATASQPPH